MSSFYAFAFTPRLQCSIVQYNTLSQRCPALPCSDYECVKQKFYSINMLSNKFVAQEKCTSWTQYCAFYFDSVLIPHMNSGSLLDASRPQQNPGHGGHRDLCGGQDCQRTSCKATDVVSCGAMTPAGDAAASEQEASKDAAMRALPPETANPPPLQHATAAISLGKGEPALVHAYVGRTTRLRRLSACEDEPHSVRVLRRSTSGQVDLETSPGTSPGIDQILWPYSGESEWQWRNPDINCWSTFHGHLADYIKSLSRSITKINVCDHLLGTCQIDLEKPSISFPRHRPDTGPYCGRPPVGPHPMRQVVITSIIDQNSKYPYHNIDGKWYITAAHWAWQAYYHDPDRGQGFWQDLSDALSGKLCEEFQIWLETRYSKQDTYPSMQVSAGCTEVEQTGNIARQLPAVETKNILFRLHFRDFVMVDISHGITLPIRCRGFSVSRQQRSEVFSLPLP